MQKALHWSYSSGNTHSQTNHRKITKLPTESAGIGSRPRYWENHMAILMSLYVYIYIYTVYIINIYIYMYSCIHVCMDSPDMPDYQRVVVSTQSWSTPVTNPVWVISGLPSLHRLYWGIPEKWINMVDTTGNVDGETKCQTTECFGTLCSKKPT